jgi:N-methylhydantoinase A
MLDRGRAERAIEKDVARPMGVGVIEAARAIRQVVDNQMGDAIFKEVVLKGYDPRQFVLFAFGGGGPLHACGYAEVLGIGRIVVPPHSPVFSAAGAAGLDLLHVYERSQHITLFDPLSKSVLEDFTPFNVIVDEFVARAREEFADEGHPAEQVSLGVELDLRSGNQLYVTTISSPVLRLETREDLAAVMRAYFDEYSNRFGEFALTREVGVSVETVRLRAAVPRRHWELRRLTAPSGGVELALKGRRDVAWPTGAASTPIYDHRLIGPRHELSGPALLEAADTTVALYPDWSARMDSYGFLTLTKETAA